MLTMRHHNSRDYAMLPNIDETDAGTISADDQACLDEIGRLSIASEASLAICRNASPQSLSN